MTGAVPDGWVPVPVEPTEAMIAAWFDAPRPAEIDFRPAYRAMLAATPSPQPVAEVERVSAALQVARDAMVRHFGPGKSNATPAGWVLDAMQTYAAARIEALEAGLIQARSDLHLVMLGTKEHDTFHAAKDVRDRVHAALTAPRHD